MVRVFAAILLLLTTAPALAQRGTQCVGSWATSVYAPEERNALPAADLNEATLRQVVRVTLGNPSIVSRPVADRSPRVAK